MYAQLSEVMGTGCFVVFGWKYDQLPEVIDARKHIGKISVIDSTCMIRWRVEEGFTSSKCPARTRDIYEKCNGPHPKSFSWSDLAFWLDIIPGMSAKQ